MWISLVAFSLHVAVHSSIPRWVYTFQLRSPFLSKRTFGKHHIIWKTQDENTTQHTHTHTLTKTKASCAKVMTEDVPCFMMVKQTACQKEEKPNKTSFNIDHHVHVILEKQVHEESVLSSYQPIVMPSSLDTQHHYRECPPAHCVKNMSACSAIMKFPLHLVKGLNCNSCTRAPRGKIIQSIVHQQEIHHPKLVQVLLLLRRYTHTPSQEGWVFKASFSQSV